MNAKTYWNSQPKTDTVAFSALIAAGVLLAWIAAAVPMVDAGVLPVMAQTVAQPAVLANGPRIVITASRLTKING